MKSKAIVKIKISYLIKVDQGYPLIFDSFEFNGVLFPLGGKLYLVLSIASHDVIRPSPANFMLLIESPKLAYGSLKVPTLSYLFHSLPDR